MRFRAGDLIPVMLAGGQLLSASISVADAPAHVGIEVKDAWIRWMPAGLPNAGYMTLSNTSAVSEVLSGAASADYREVHIHQTVRQEGVISMHAVKSIEIKPQASVQFARQGYHLMLLQPSHPMNPGDHVKISLQFEQRPPIEVDFVVRQETAS